MTNMIEVTTLDGATRFPVYRAAPAAAPRGVVIVIQEIFGINPGIRAKVDHWASLGYLAFAPDLFWRDARGIELDPDVPEQFQTALGHMQALDLTLAVTDIEAVIHAARSEAGADIKIGVVGYCLGGRLAFLAAARTDIDASVAYYGGGIDGFLGEAKAIARPMLLHYAADDHFIDAAAREKTAAALADKEAEIFVYPDVDHGFASTFGARRQEAAANAADARTEAFFAKQLG